MHMMAQWEDETNNRQVQFSVDYAIENGQVEINDVTPVKVTFVEPSTNTSVKSIGIHTITGRKMLAKQFQASGKMEDFATEIARRNDLLVAS